MYWNIKISQMLRNMLEKIVKVQMKDTLMYIIILVYMFRKILEELSINFGYN